MGSEVATLAGSWRWGLRITPILAFMALAVGIFSLRDPPRGNILNNNKIRMSYKTKQKFLFEKFSSENCVS